MYVTLALARAHCNAEADVPDSLLSLYIESAERSCEKYVGQPLEDLEETEGDPETIPAEIRHAILLYVGTAVLSRETVVIGTIFSELPAASRLLQPYRVDLGV
jgi:Phage gp6-like head-tail connector protein